MIDIDKYETKKERNWKLKATYPDRDNSVEAFNGYEDIVAVDSLGRERYTVAQMVDTGLEDAQLIADAPLLLAEVKRLQTIMYEIEAHNGVSAEVIAASSDALFMNELLAEVKRLREAIADIANNMEAADPSYLQGFIKDLLEVIEWKH